MTRFGYQSPVILLLFLLPITIWSSSRVGHRPCVNRKKVVVCSNLKHIPVLPRNTTSLLLINFQVPLLSRNSLSNLIGLPLNKLQLKQSIWGNVTTDVFTDMIHLRTLVISRLKLFSNLPKLFLSLKFTNITSITLDRVILGRIQHSLFEGLRNTNLYHLRLRQCYLKIFNGAYLTHLTKLNLLDLSANNNLQIESWGYLPSLNILNLTETYMEHLLSFQNESFDTHNVYPELRTLSLSLSDDYNLDHVTFNGLPKLTDLRIQARDELQMMTDTIGSQLPKLKNMLLIGTPNVKLKVDDKAIVSLSLQSLRLKNIILKNSNKPFYCPNLTNLVLSRFKAANPARLLRSLLTLQQLKRLEISNSRLTAVPDSICNLTTLTKLDLHGNFIYSWKNKDCQVMKHLKCFSLAKNNIKKTNESYFSETLWENPKLKWDLSFNNYYCNCDLVWFRDWLLKTKQRVIDYPNGYRCKLRSGLYIKIPNLALTREYCLDRFRTSPLILLAISLSVLAVVLITCSVVAYLKRWSMSYWCYLLWARHRKYTSLADNIDYVYDAFICYSSRDIKWVINSLVPVIEETNGYQLCLHDRDFRPGNNIVDNILESVQTSRRVVLVLTPEFARSCWCRYEASLAEQRLIEEDRDMLVPVLLQEIPNVVQSRRLATLLNTRTCLEWTEDERGQEIFWRRLTDILGTPLMHND